MTNLKRKLCSLTLCLLVSLGIMAQASPAQAAHVYQNGWGATVEFNREETNHLTLGAGTWGGLAVLVRNPVAVYAAVGLGVYTNYANWVYNRGGCMRAHIQFSFIGMPVTLRPDHYFGGYCH